MDWIETIYYATHPVLRTRATRAWRYLFRGPQRDVDSVHATLSDLLAPMADVQIGDGAARNARISENCRQVTN